jgi:tetratricopeptide (TPR) repeat protein
MSHPMKPVLTLVALSAALLLWSYWLIATPDSPRQRAEAARLQGHYEEALEEYQRAVAEGETAASVAFSQGVCLYHLDRYAEAAERFEAAEKTDAAHVARAAFNLGNCALKRATSTENFDAAVLDEAIQHYRDCLRREANSNEPAGVFQDARYNLELAKLLQAKQHDENYKPHDDPNGKDDSQQIAKNDPNQSGPDHDPKNSEQKKDGSQQGGRTIPKEKPKEGS